jgi:hypothetical protein
MLVKDLCDRYSLSSRKSLYSRLNALSLELGKDAQGRSYATPEQLEQLDQLHQHLKDGGILTNFTPVTPVVITTQHTAQPAESGFTLTTQHTTQHGTQLTTQAITPEFLGEFAGAIASRLIVSPLSPHRELEEAAEKGWLLTTAEVRELIGVKPTAAKGEDSYQRGCWAFTKAGKIGSQTAWRVSKQGYLGDEQVF